MKICDHLDTPGVNDQSDHCVLYECRRYCLNKCKHMRCTQRCRTECDRPPCYEKCTRRLECEHHCNGICGEPCINCLSCREKELPMEIRRAISGRDNLRYATFVQLECGDLFKTEVLDEYVENFRKQ